MIYETKTALVLRRDLAAWQMANIAAFLVGIVLAGTHGHMMGEPTATALAAPQRPDPRAHGFVFGATLELRRT